MTWKRNWKGVTGAVGAALAALGGIAVDLEKGTLTTEKFTVYLAAVGGALSLFGIREAIGKQPEPPPPRT